MSRKKTANTGSTPVVTYGDKNLAAIKCPVVGCEGSGTPAMLGSKKVYTCSHCHRQFTVTALK